MKFKSIFSTLILLCVIVSNALAQTTSNGVTTFSTSKDINNYTIESNISKVIINTNVKLKGNFWIANRSQELTIEGKGENSILEGNTTTKHGIEADSHFTLNLNNFKSLNPGKYHMRLIKTVVHAYKVHLIDDTNDTGANHDGFSANGGSTFDQCYINTWDDCFKIYYGDYTVTNTTIVHNKNGAPFQMGWGDAISDECNLYIDNVTVISNANSYNQGVFSWVGDSQAEIRNIHVNGQGLKRQQNSGNDPFGDPIKEGHLYQFGNNGGSAYNKTMKFFVNSNQCSLFQNGVRIDRNSSDDNFVNITCDNSGGCTTPSETTVSKTNATCGSSDGKIKFTFNDTDGRSSISFSINGGSNYTKVGDNTSNYTFNNLAEGTYNCWVKWGNGDCPTSLGNVVVGCSGGTSTVETVFVVNKSTGYKIRVKTDEGNAIAQAPSEWTGTWMQWEVINTSNGYFRLKFRGNNQYLSMPTTADGDVVYASGNTTTKEEWKKVDKGNGYFLLENKASGKRIRARADANMSIGGDYLVEVSKIGWEGDWVQWKFEDASAYKSAKMDSEIASSEASEFTVYPNPASQFITLHAPNASPNAMVTIYTIGGKSVLHTTMSGVSTHVNIEGLQSGIYFIQLKDAQTTSSKKLIIQ